MNPFRAWLLAATFFEAWSSVSGGICQTFVWSNLRPVSQRWSQRSCVRYTSETQAGSLSTSVPVPQRAHEKPREVQELRELTWVEAEARIKRDIAEVGGASRIFYFTSTRQPNPLLEECGARLDSSRRPVDPLPIQTALSLSVKALIQLQERTDMPSGTHPRDSSNVQY